ncbi:MAG: hypothetical protein K1X88_15715 [Nannocystaceae bacterium]|nr:hypothetical protein [Nannocystaceae bacterium]
MTAASSSSSSLSLPRIRSARRARSRDPIVFVTDRDDLRAIAAELATDGLPVVVVPSASAVPGRCAAVVVDRRGDAAADALWGVSAVVSVVAADAPSRMIDGLLDRGDEVVTAEPALAGARVELALARALERRRTELELAHAQRELLLADANLLVLLSLAERGLLVVDEHERVVFANAAAGTLLGGSARALFGARAPALLATAGLPTPSRRHDILWGREPASLWVLPAPST